MKKLLSLLLASVAFAQPTQPVRNIQVSGTNNHILTGATFTADAGSTLVGFPGTGTVTHTLGNLTLNAVVIGNGLNDEDVLASLGTSGQVLTSNGAAARPTWQTAAAGGVTSIPDGSTNGVTWTVANRTTTPTFTFSLGAIAPTSVNSVVFTGVSTPHLTVTGTTSISGTNTGDQTSVTGNAGTATALQTARTINGTSFNGTANITVAAAAGTLTGNTLASGVMASSLTSAAGGTFDTGAFLPGSPTTTEGDIIVRGTSADQRLGVGTDGQVLTVDTAVGGKLKYATISGTGTVTSVAATVPSILSIAGSPITTSGTLAITYSGTALPIANGGTGRTTGTTAYGLIAAGTTAAGVQQTLAAGATTEILVGGGASALPAWTTATGSGAPARGTSPAFTTNFTLANGTAPTTSAVAQTAFDTNAWGTGRGAIQVHDGTAATYVVAALASSAPTNGQVPTWNTGGTIDWQTPAGSGTVTHTGSLTANQVVVGNGTADVKILAAGTDTNVLTMVSGAPAWAAAGSGSIGGSTGSTDNALIRADGTGGATVQSSNVTIADSGTAFAFSGAAGLTAGGSNQNIQLTPSGSGYVRTDITTGVAQIMRASSASGYASYRIYNDLDSGPRALEMGYSGSSYASPIISGGITGESSYITSTGAYPLQFGVNNTAVFILNAAGNASFLGSLTPDQVLGIVGTTTNNNTNAGSVGETVASSVAIGSPVSLTTNTGTNITSISLTAGDWDVSGNVNFSASTATVTGTSGGISTTSATVPTDGTEVYSGVQVTLLSEIDSVTLPTKRLSLSGTTTVYLVGKSIFSAGSVGGFGSITARRRR